MAIRLRDHLRYRFDNTMSKGLSGLIFWLFVLSMVLALAVAVIVMLAGHAPKGAPTDFQGTWFDALQRTTNLAVEKAGDNPYKTAMFVTKLGSLFVGGLLVGLLTTSIQTKIRNLRKGRSLVVEKDHSVILGWSPAIFTVIREICSANENRRRPCIVVMGEKDKIDMEDEIRAKVKTGRTRIVCRTGSPVDPADLALVNPSQARSFVLLSPDGRDPDSAVIKTLLSLESQKPPVDIRTCVAEMRDPKKIEVADMIGRGDVRILSIDDLIARVTVQACRQSGLSVVYSELMTFAGDEMYVHEEPAVIGKTFGDALMMYETSSVVGFVRDRKTKFNPPMDTPIATGDRLVIISEDDDTMILSGKTSYGVAEDAISSTSHKTAVAEATLILGWNRRAPWMINHLDEYVAPGSAVHVVADIPDLEKLISRDCSKVKHQKVTFAQGDTTDGRTLRALGAEKYAHVIVLGYSDKMTPQEADAQTLITLLYLREIGIEHKHPFSITSEMLDPRNRTLGEAARADDFIVSAKLVSEMLAQMSENPDLTYNELFESEGSELYLKPASDYVRPGTAVNFYTIVESARRKNEIAVGYRIVAHAQDAKKGYGVKVNPNKADTLTFAPEDKIIVIAEN